MEKLLIALATAGLFSGAGIALACDQYQQDASSDSTQMMSVGTPTVAVCDDCKVKPDQATNKKSTAKTTKKSAVKPESMALAAPRN